MGEVKQRIAMKAVVLDGEGRILILREAESGYEDGTQGGLWGLMGGRIEPGENWLEGLKREVKEEAGIEIDYIKPIYIGEWRPVIQGQETQIVAVFNLCKIKSGEVKLSEEHSDYVWMKKSDLAEYRFMDPDDKVIEAAFQEVSQS